MRHPLQQHTLRWLGLFAGLTLFAAGCVARAPVDEDDTEPLNTSGSCATFRWSVKTGTDAAAGSVNVTPQDTIVAALLALPKPSTLPQSTRIGPTELQTVRLTNVTLTQYKSEPGSDYHLGSFRAADSSRRRFLRRQPNAG